MRLAHISDLHIDFRDEKLIKSIDEAFGNILQNKVQHLIITGDLIHNPQEQNYTVLKRILKKYGYWDYNKLTVTIGNHEIFGGAEKTHTFPYQCKCTNYDDEVRKFLLFFKEILFSGNINDFPIIKEINERIVLIIINSVARWSKNQNPIGSNGYVDSVQMKKIDDSLKNDKYENFFKIAVIHHHFYYTADNSYDEMHRLWLYSERDTMVMHNYGTVFKLLKRNNIDLILHGHTHYTNVYRKGNLKIVNSSGCIKPLSQVKEKLYTIIEIKEKDKKPEFMIKHQQY